MKCLSDPLCLIYSVLKMSSGLKVELSVLCPKCNTSFGHTHEKPLWSKRNLETDPYGNLSIEGEMVCCNYCDWKEKHICLSKQQN